MNLPNKLTILRVVLVPVFMAVILLPNMTGGSISARVAFPIAAVLFAVSAFTDFLDGKIARKRELVTNFGKFMDPLADKFMVLGALVALIGALDGMRTLLIWTTAVVIFRELAVTSMRLVAKDTDGAVIAAATLGKVKTFSQCVCILLLLLEDLLLPFPLIETYRPLSHVSLLCMLIFTVWSGIDYLKSYWKYISPSA